MHEEDVFRRRTRRPVDDLPLFRTHDPHTSQDGAVSVRARRGSQADRLEVAIRAAGAAGLTAYEAGEITGLVDSGSGYWKRVSELHAAGRIVYTGVDRLMQATGDRQRVFITPEWR